MPVRGDARSLASEDNGYMDPAGDQPGWRAEALRRVAAGPHAPAVAGALLAVAAGAQALAQPAGNAGSYGGDLQVAFVLLALFTTLPLGLLWAHPAAAAVTVCAACLLSLAAFHALTVAGLITQLVVLYRLGRRGSQLLAAGLALSFLVLALAGPAGSAARIPTVLLAALGPAAAWAGAARRARAEAERAQRRPAGHRRHPGRAHGPRGTRPCLPRAARRRGPPHFHDRRAGRDGPADHAGDARRRSAAAVGDRRHRPGGADRDAAATRRAARGHRDRRRGAAARSPACCSSTSCSTRHGTPQGRASASSSAAP